MERCSSLDAFATSKLKSIINRNLRRQLNPTSRFAGGYVTRGNRRSISFCDNDYLGLATDPRVIAAAQNAAVEYGVGAGASRLVTGDNPLNQKIERKLARLKNTERALLFGSGYLANIGTIPTLVGPGDAIVLDELSHACMLAGAQLSGAKVVKFAHNSLKDLEEILARVRCSYRRVLVLTETVFSMDGDRAPLQQISDLCRRQNAWLMTDDAHGFGVVDQENPADIQMGTLSKAAGSYGGYVCGSEPLIELLTNRARSLIFTTGLPPTVLAATDAALDIITKEPERGHRALSHAKKFCAALNLPAPESAIVPLICGTERAALNQSSELAELGYLVAAIRPPTVPKGTARLRVTFSAAHLESEVAGLIAAIQLSKVPA